MGNLTNRIALVTGGATGIGRAITLALAAQGCRVAFHHFRSAPDELIEELAGMGCEVLNVQGDLTQDATAQTVVHHTVEHFGGLDILVNNAGDILARHKLEEMELSFIQKIMAVNIVRA